MSLPSRSKPAEHQPRPARLLSLNDVCDRTGRSRWWVRGAVLDGRFPKPVSTGSRSPRWVEHEIDGWIARLIADRDSLTADAAAAGGKAGRA